MRSRTKRLFKCTWLLQVADSCRKHLQLPVQRVEADEVCWLKEAEALQLYCVIR